jgi:hypothetical protein
MEIKNYGYELHLETTETRVPPHQCIISLHRQKDLIWVVLRNKYLNINVHHLVLLYIVPLV